MDIIVNNKRAKSLEELENELKKIDGDKVSVLFKDLKKQGGRYLSGVKEVIAEDYGYRLVLKEGYSTHNSINGKVQISDYGVYNNIEELIEGMTNIYKPIRF